MIDKEYTSESIVDYHARLSAKALRNIATSDPVQEENKVRLLHTIKIQDKLYKTDYKNFLQKEQIEYLEYLEGVHNG